MSIPIFLLAFANDTARLLPKLGEEANCIIEALDKAKAAKLCDYILRPFATLDQILGDFSKHRNEIIFFHYAGHANSFQLLLEDSAGKVAAANARGLADFLSQQRGLELVFLNGCSTELQAASLIDANVSMVIATSQAIDDEVAMHFASRFYQSVADGASIETSFKEAEASIRAAKGDDFRHLYVDGARLEPKAIQRWPWKLYVKEGAEKEKEWSLPAAANNPLYNLPELPKEDLPPEPFLHLSWFRKEHAEIFFGRDYQIRQMYDRVTEPHSDPIVLLYGQSGVGKSSFLDAGVSPRLQAENTVLYLRRNQEAGSTGTIAAQLGVVLTDIKEMAEAISKAWHEKERQEAKPLIIILDQIEELFTRPNKIISDELPDFLLILEKVFGVKDSRPHGKLILSFRKEWISEIENALLGYKLPHSKVFLERLDRKGIIQAIRGVTTSTRLRDKYKLTIEPNLPEIIADDLLSDADAPIAPILQILLSKMWMEAKKNNNSQPVFEMALYRDLKRQGLLLGDFLDQQLGKLKELVREIVDSGLAIDFLTYYTTPLGTAEQHSPAEVAEEYKHLADQCDALLAKLTELYLLADSSKDQQDPAVSKDLRLTHDTLAPLVRSRFNKSIQPGQRARRILENRVPEWREDQEGTELQEHEIEIAELGKSGMRRWTDVEEKLMAVSRKARDERARQRKIQKLVRSPLFGGIGAGLGVGLVRALLPVENSGQGFVLYLFFAGVSGAALSAGIALAKLLQLKSTKESDQQIETPYSTLRKALLRITLGTSLFGITHFIFIWLMSQYKVSYFVVLMGFALGFGLSVSLSLPMSGGKLSKPLTWAFRMIIAAMTFVLVNEFFLTVSDYTPYNTVLHTLITVSSDTLRDFIDSVTQLPLWIKIIQRYADDYKIMAAIHGALTGIFMITGLTLGLRLNDNGKSRPKVR